MTQLLVVASARELPPPRDTWGHGGWLPPEQREALDWLTFARLSGWSVTARTPAGPLDHATRWIVVGLNEPAWSRTFAFYLLPRPLDSCRRGFCFMGSRGETRRSVSSWF